MTEIHHLDYVRTRDITGRPHGIHGMCTCGDFACWVEGVDDAAEVGVLTLHDCHVQIEAAS